MIRELYKKIRDGYEAQYQRHILWVPFLMALGVAGYFHLRHEPPLWLAPALCPVLAAGIWYSRRARLLCLLLTVALLIISGALLAQTRTQRMHSPVLEHQMNYARVVGTVEEITPTPKGSKLRLKDVAIEGVTPEKTPLHVNISLRSYDANLVTGQRIATHAGLYPPPEPAMPGGFDFSRYFFFHETGAVGYGIGPLETEPLPPAFAQSGELRFAEFRHRLTESIRSHFREPAGSIAAAFITGEVRTIPESVNDDMRVSGLTHLLAVSGMNLSVVAGLSFFTFRLVLALIPGIGLRFNIKKWAAALALGVSYLYLVVAGSPVSAERAFLMVGLIFLAILLDRDPTPMRSVAFAAFVILLFEPEEVLTAVSSFPFPPRRR